MREKRISVPMCPMAYPKTVAATMAMPPMVGVPGLGGVRGGAVLPDVLAELALAEVADQEGGEEDGDPQSDASRDKQAEHVASGLRQGVPEGADSGAARAGSTDPGRPRRCRPGPRVRGEPHREGPAGLDRIVEGEPLSADLLVRLVTLARDDHHVARPRRIERQADGHTAVGLDHDVRVGPPAGDAAPALPR